MIDKDSLIASAEFIALIIGILSLVGLLRVGSIEYLSAKELDVNDRGVMRSQTLQNFRNF